MTDKEIIDGVDVSECEDNYRICVNTREPEVICKKYKFCSKNSNCYFKQLARLNAQYNAVVEQNKNLQGELNHETQKCEELEKTYDTLQNTWIKQSKYLHRYRRAFEEIKEIAHRLRTKRDYNSPDEVNKDIDSILQKCEVINSESKET